MNNPEYILTDEWATIAAAVKAALGISVLNYQYGEVTELNETLIQWSKSPDHASLKFPLIWVEEPFVISRGEPGIYGTLDGGRIFIINQSTATWKAAERMTNNFKAVIYPIYRELLNQIVSSDVFQDDDLEKLKHKTSNRYYYGESSRSVLNDVVDTMVVSDLNLRINNKSNCTTFSNF